MKKCVSELNKFYRCFGTCRIVALLAATSSVSAVAGTDTEKRVEIAEQETTSGWKWSVGLGAAYRNLGEIHLSGGSNSSIVLLPVSGAGQGSGNASNAAGLGIGPAKAFANRTYRDGFVFVDGPTGNPGSFLPGTTSFWGYNSAGQVRNGNLFFNGGEINTTSVQTSRSVRSADVSDDFEGVAPVLEVKGMHEMSPQWSVGFLASFLYTHADSDQKYSNFNASQTVSRSSFSVTDRYDLQGVVPPPAPYVGVLNPPGTAPLIDNLPTERITAPTGTSRVTSDFFNRVAASLQINLYTVSLGPAVAYRSGDFDLSGSLGLALNIADVNADYQESLNLRTGGTTSRVASWQAGNNQTDLIPGFFLQAAAAYSINPAWKVSVFGRYDWSDSVSGAVGPSDYSVELTGYTVGVAVAYEF